MDTQDVEDEVGTHSTMVMMIKFYYLNVDDILIGKAFGGVAMRLPGTWPVAAPARDVAVQNALGQLRSLPGRARFAYYGGGLPGARALAPVQ